MSDLQKSIESLAERFGIAASELKPVIEKRQDEAFEINGVDSVFFRFGPNGVFSAAGTCRGKRVNEGYCFEAGGDFCSLDAFYRMF